MLTFDLSLASAEEPVVVGATTGQCRLRADLNDDYPLAWMLAGPVLLLWPLRVGREAAEAGS